MHIVCPHCHNPLELINLTTQEEILCSSCGSSFRLEEGSTSGWSPCAGQKLGRFELLAIVGHGSFGTVYKAHDPELQREVAIKVPRAGNLTTSDNLDRFLREARSVAQLRHPAIVSMHEVGQQDGVPFLVSDFVHGMTLADLLTARRPSPQQAAKLLLVVADALHYAHERGVVHRDVKPSNILLGDNDTPYLMDFGLAKRDAGEITMTVDGQVLGTPAYMSPEQARGDSHKVDGRSDVYSLGAILYQLLTGEPPFRGNSRMLLHQVLHDEPRPPRRLNDRIPRDLETICLKAMAKEIGRRYRSAADFAADLRRFLGGQPIKARPVGRIERLGRWCRRNPALAAVTGLAAAALLAVTALSGLYAVSQAESNTDLARANANLIDEQQETIAANKATGAALKKAEGFSADLARSLEDKQQQLSLMALQRARSLMDERELPHALLWLGRALELAPSKAGDLQRVIRVNLAEVQAELITLKAVIPNANNVTTVAFSPDGKTFLTGEGGRDYDDKTGTVRFWETATALPRLPIINLDGSLRHLAWSPDGKMLLTAGPPRPGLRTGAYLWDVATGKKLVPPLAQPPIIWTTAFSPDSKTVLTTWGLTSPGGGEGRLWSTATGKMIGQPLAHNTVVHNAAFSPDGKLVLTGSMDGTARLWDAVTTRPFGPPLPHPGGVSRVGFSPDGSKFFTAGGNVAVAGGETHLRVWRTADQKPIGQPFSSVTGTAAFSPDGKLIVLLGSGLLRFLDPANGSPVGLPIPTSTIHFSPDGRWLAGADGDGFTVRLWEVPSGNPVGPPMRHLGQVTSVAFSPDGRYLLTAADDKTVRLWELPPGRLREVARTLDDPELHDNSDHTRLRSGFAALGWLDDPALHSSSDHRVAWRRHGDKGVELVEPATGQSRGPLQHAYSVQNGWFSPDGKTLAVHSMARQPQQDELRFWDTATARPIATPTGPPGSQPSVTFSPDSKTVLVTWVRYAYQAGVRRTVSGASQLWQLATGKSRSEPLPPGGENLSGQFSPDSQHLAVHWFDSEKKTSQVRIWKTATTADSGAFHQAGAINGLTFSPESRLLVTAGSDRTVRRWDTATAEPVGQPLQLPWAAEKVTFSSDSKVLFASTRNAGGLQAWDVGAGKIISELTWDAVAPIFLFSPDRKVFAVQARPVRPNSTKDNPDRTVAFLDATTGRLLGQPLEHPNKVTSVRFSPDGKAVLTASEDRTVRHWEVSSGKELTPPLVHEGAVSQVAISPDGRTLLTVSKKSTVRLWEAITGKVIGQPLPHSDELSHVDFSPDGRFVRTITSKPRPFETALTSRVGTARFWDVATGLPLGMPVAISLRVQFPTDGGALLARLDGRHALSWSMPPPIPGATAQVACWTQVLTGMELSPDGVLGALDGSAVADRRRRLESLGGPPVGVADAGERLRAGDWLAIQQGVKDLQWAPVLWHVERLLQAEPQETALRYLRGRAHFELGHWSQAVSDLTAAIEAQAAGPEVWYQRGWARAYLGQTDEALGDFARALQQRPKDPALLLAQYFVHSRRGEWGLAEADRVAAISNMGQPGTPYFPFAPHLQDRGAAFSNPGQVQFAGGWNPWDQAVTAHTRALEAGLNDWWVWSGRAVAHWGLGRWKEAAADYAEALERKPGDWRLWNLRCVLYNRFGQYDQAIADSTRALELKKDEVVLWMNRATNYARKFQWEKAIADYSEALKLQPRSVQVRAARADAHASIEQWDKAAADYAQLIEQKAANPALWHRLALLRLQKGDDAGYRATCEDLVRRFGRAPNIELANTVAWTCSLAPDALADPTVAFQFALGAVSATEVYIRLPGEQSGLKARLYMNTLGAAAYRAGHFEFAIAALEKTVAAQREGGTPMDWLLLAMAHHRLGRAEHAKAFLDHSVQWLEQSTRDKPRDASLGSPVGWETWTELQLLRREAETLDAGDKKALAALDRAIKDKPKEATVWVERARYRKYHRHNEQAEADYSRAIEVQPDNPLGRRERGRFYAQQRQWDKAAADFLKVVEQQPKDLLLRLECAQACAESAQWEQAAAQFEKARELGNAPAMVWYYQALAHLGAGQLVEYRRLCARMLVARGPGAPPLALIVQTCRAGPDAVTDFAPLLALAEKLTAAQPGSYPVLRLHGQLLYRAGKFEAAVQQLDLALKGRLGRPDLSYATDALYLAMAHQRLAHGPEARQWLQRAVQLIEQVERDRLKAVTATNVPEPWYNRLVVQRLRQEAEALVK